MSQIGFKVGNWDGSFCQAKRSMEQKTKHEKIAAESKNPYHRYSIYNFRPMLNSASKPGLDYIRSSIFDTALRFSSLNLDYHSSQPRLPSLPVRPPRTATYHSPPKWLPLPPPPVHWSVPPHGSPCDVSLRLFHRSNGEEKPTSCSGRPASTIARPNLSRPSRTVMTIRRQKCQISRST